MVAIWANAVMAGALSYYQAALKAAWTDRAIEYAEDWSPTPKDLRRALDQVWVRGYQVVTAAYQMERWRQAYEGAGNEVEIEYLRHLRNSIEHLDAARFTEYTAHKGAGKDDAWSIEKLPGKELFLGFDGSFMTAAFGIVELATVTAVARRYLYVGEPDDDEW
jgi:hypothetical protein